MSAPISVFIITLNEEARIGAAVASLSGCVDEVIVPDSGSTDRTCVVAEALGAKVHFREWVSYGPQKRAAECLCIHP